MITDTRKNILEFITLNREVSANQIINEFNLSPQIVHRHLKKLLNEGHVARVGTPPRVFYQVKEDKSTLLST